MDLLVDAEDFLLLGLKAAAKKVSHFETDEIWWRRPVGKSRQLAFLIELFRHLCQSMNQPVEIGNNVAIEVLDNFA